MKLEYLVGEYNGEDIWVSDGVSYDMSSQFVGGAEPEFMPICVEPQPKAGFLGVRVQKTSFGQANLMLGVTEVAESSHVLSVSPISTQA